MEAQKAEAALIKPPPLPAVPQSDSGFIEVAAQKAALPAAPQMPFPAQGIELRFVYDGEEKALQEVPVVEDKLDLDKIGKELFGLFPTSTTSTLGRHPSVQEVVQAAGPLLLGGNKAYFAPGTRGRLFRRGLTLGVHIKEPLHFGFLPDHVHAYSINLEGCKAPVLLKLFYRRLSVPKWDDWDIIEESDLLRDIATLAAAQGVKCHSLPAMVEKGAFATGDPSLGVSCLALKPHVAPLAPSRTFSGRQLCNAAFDVLLAIHQLRMVHRNVSSVERSDLLFVEEQQVFVFANLAKTQRLCSDDVENGVAAHGLLVPVTLVLALAALSGMQVAGVNELGYPDETEVGNATARLREEHHVLGDLADALACQPWLYGKVEYKKWLLALAGVCDRSPSMIRKPRFLETAMKRMTLGCHQPWRKHNKLR